MKNLSIGELYAEIFSRKSNPIDFDDFSFYINPKSGGGVYYSQSFYEEFNNSLFKQIKAELKPKLILDIGANIGLYSCLFAKLFDSSEVLSFEPNESAHSLLVQNLSANNISNCKAYKKIVGNEINQRSFQVNSEFDVDSRCSGLENFEEVLVDQITLDEILKNIDNLDLVFLKIDVQGYEPQIFDGGKDFFSRHEKFILKVEFAPHWLESQENDPILFLNYLVNNFKVIECIDYGFQTSSLSERFMKPINPDNVVDFVEYVARKNRDLKGHVDLLIVPRTFFE